MSKSDTTASDLIDYLESWQPFTPISSAQAARLAESRGKIFTVEKREDVEKRRPLTTLFETGKSKDPKPDRPPPKGSNLPAIVYLPFTVNDNFSFDQTPENIVFGTLPRATNPVNPHSSAYRSTHKSSETNEKVYNRLVRPVKIHDCFFRSHFHQTFKEALDKVADSRLRGFQSLAFDYRCERLEGDTGDSVLLNMLLPILELVQKFIKESFPKHRIIIASQYNATVKNGKKDIKGSVDYVFFAVLNNARTAQFEEVKIVDHMPRKQKEWRALVVVEAKKFGTIYPEEFVQQTWETRYEKRAEPETTHGIQIEALTKRDGNCASNAGSIVRQIRKYSEGYECDYIFVTDYINSAAICIPHHLARGSRSQIGRNVKPTPIETQMIGNLNRDPNSSSRYNTLPIDGNPLEYGPRCALLYMIWHALNAETEKTLALARAGKAPKK